MLEQQTLDEPPYIYHNDRTQSNQKFVVCREFLLKNSVKHLQTTDVAESIFESVFRVSSNRYSLTLTIIQTLYSTSIKIIS